MLGRLDRGVGGSHIQQNDASGSGISTGSGNAGEIGQRGGGGGGSHIQQNDASGSGISTGSGQGEEGGEGGSRMFAVGYGLQAAISTLSVVTTVLRRPTALRDTLFSRLNLKLAAFMGGYSAIFRAVNCVLRWVRGRDAAVHGLVGGALAGLSLRFYRSVTIALYAATKLVEILYFKGIESCGFPYIKSADIFIYAFSTAFIFHAAVMEPHTLRPGYWKFLLRVTGNKFALMNRRLLDIFGVNSSKIAPDYWPNYDPAFTELARGPS
ncbi:hypothetical protein RRG08_009931 [Elysia crispata]|uniref:Transmembrane protein 135 N-terminal domain-containing protein n=1 Tax=Elysia crispata TaxID=231223 RepID=A0AAE1E3F1_9GAST|nr:hypothetical protein RRG08_009931 [Elysia crispata]